MKLLHSFTLTRDLSPLLRYMQKKVGLTKWRASGIIQSMTYILAVPEGAKMERLDKYIAENIENMNRSKLKSGAVKIEVNGKPEKISRKIRAGDEIRIEWENAVPKNIESENIPLEIIYEDSDVTVVNKAQGMVTHPAAGNWTGTLVNALLWRWGKDGSADLRPGIVHRLDKDTSGVIITARNRASEEILQKQIRAHSTKKEYILIVQGSPKESSGTIKTQIIRDPADRKRFKAVTDTSAGKTAITHYRCFASYGGYSLIRVRLGTGRTHQIRVHMKYLGCPILGDSIYSRRDKIFPDATLMLHARSLTIRLPNGKTEVFKADVPLRFKKILKYLHENFKKETH